MPEAPAQERRVELDEHPVPTSAAAGRRTPRRPHGEKGQAQDQEGRSRPCRHEKDRRTRVHPGDRATDRVRYAA